MLLPQKKHIANQFFFPFSCWVYSNFRVKHILSEHYTGEMKKIQNKNATATKTTTANHFFFSFRCWACLNIRVNTFSQSTIPKKPTTKNQEQKSYCHKWNNANHFFFPFGCWAYLASRLAKKLSDWAARAWFRCCISIAREASVSSSFSFLASFAASFASAVACRSQKSRQWETRLKTQFWGYCL